MSDSITVTYLDHSGFWVETARHRLLFDYYRDPAQAAPPLAGKPLYIFASHAHGDHFNPAIAAWKESAVYILSSDIGQPALPAVAPERVHVLAPYGTLELGDVSVAAYGSTDAGGSFHVAVDGWNIFHAGDLNWWHWKGDTPQNIAQAKTDFFRELDRLKGKQFDLAFFPVDSRLEEYRACGVNEFVKAVSVMHLITMHDCGQPWSPPPEFSGSSSLWVPARPGESRRLPK